MFRNLEQILQSYNPLEIIVEMAIIWWCVYLIVRFLRGTRGANVIQGFAVLLVALTLAVRVVGEWLGAFGRLTFIYDRFLGIMAILLIVVFQPELRQAMIRLGHARLFRAVSSRTSLVVDAVADAVELLAKSQFGALIAIERDVKLGGLAEGGQKLDAQVSSRLLESIFWPNSPLHDLGVIIRDDRVVAANVQFPLAEDGTLPPTLGSRHRAALGITLESDCIVVVVSEETGAISLAQDGRLDHNIPPDRFKAALAKRLNAAPPGSPAPGNTGPGSSGPGSSTAGSSAAREADDPESDLARAMNPAASGVAGSPSAELPGAELPGAGLPGAGSARVAAAPGSLHGARPGPREVDHAVSS